MSIQLPAGSSPTKNQIKPEYILAEWNRAIIEVHKNYNQLFNYINDAATGKNQCKQRGKFIGQCPVDQLGKLVTTIYTELEKLIQDMNQFGAPEQTTVLGQYKRLAGHTLILNQLNQQAQLSLQLLTISSS